MGRQAGSVRAYIGPYRESSGSRPEDPAVLLGPNGLVASHNIYPLYSLYDTSLLYNTVSPNRLGY